ncbi:MAG: hypothetical protein WCY89_05030 [Flavobacteriaceae bacterium]
MKRIFLLLVVTVLVSCQKSENSKADEFWEQLQTHCGKAYEGTLTYPLEDADFGDKKLVMHIRECSENQIKIPFFVGDDKSRTWIFTRKDGKIELKHDHRHEDGTPEDITMYGGLATNTGQATIQIFPADEQTTAMLPAASTNVWWVTLDHGSFTYNLRRVGSDRLFTVTFDLSKTVEIPDAPWGWEEGKNK